MYKFEIGQSVCLKPNFVELWNLNNRRLPLPQVVEHFQGLIGKELLILDASDWCRHPFYNIDGFAFEEYILAPYQK